ncbi:MAG: flagellar hook-length control protein FliK [Agathobacter sp.]|nr:flagellar hook-length control protein FliK [Agathobacter sp.]
MQVSDLVQQYNNATARPEMTGTKGIRKLVSTLRDMKSGNIFEGTVNAVKGGKVTLGLPNGQEVTARMDGKVPLTIGQSMFFQVKSNDGTQIAIRPYTVEGNSMNLTLLEALKTANIPVDGRNLSMVNAMMEEQMPIDRNSLGQMARIINNNPDFDVKTLVQMQKLDIPITPEMASQFQNYLDDKQAIGNAMSNFIEELPKALANGELSVEQLGETAEAVVRILTEGLPEEIVPSDGSANVLDGQNVQSITTENTLTNTSIENESTESTPVENISVNELTAGPEETGADDVRMTENGENVQRTDETIADVLPQEQTQPDTPYVKLDESLLKAVLAEDAPYAKHTVGAVLDENQIEDMTELLGKFLEAAQNPSVFADGGLVLSGSTTALLHVIRAQLAAGGMDKETILSLLSGKGFAALVKDAMEQQWLVKPEEIIQKDKLTRLYEKIENQLTKLEDAVKTSGQTSENVTSLAADIRNNIQFMDQINQTYTYVQLPMKLAGQNASGQLYVYTNKKNLTDPDKELTAFLHLDLDHLGSTDVSVKMLQKHVKTNFYFDNDESYELVRANAPLLEERLRAKGYNCDIQVKNEQKAVNFVEDFLKKDQPSAGMVHRYSFDMRA